jgi:hypothetical protein
MSNEWQQHAALQRCTTKLLCQIASAQLSFDVAVFAARVDDSAALKKIQLRESLGARQQ